VLVRCVKAFGQFGPGAEVEVPDGAAVDPAHWQPVTAPAPDIPPPPDSPPAPSSPPVVTPKEEA